MLTVAGGDMPGEPPAPSTSSSTTESGSRSHDRDDGVVLLD